MIFTYMHNISHQEKGLNKYTRPFHQTLAKDVADTSCMRGGKWTFEIGSESWVPPDAFGILFRILWVIRRVMDSSQSHGSFIFSLTMSQFIFRFRRISHGRCRLPWMMSHVIFGFWLTERQSHGLSWCLQIMSQVILGFWLIQYQSHGLSKFSFTMSHVILRFALTFNKDQGLSGLSFMMSHVIFGFWLILYQFQGLSG